MPGRRTGPWDFDFHGAKPHEYSWHFQTYARRTIETLGQSIFRISDGAASLTLGGACAQGALRVSLCPTEIVWAYSIGGQAVVAVEFSVTW